MNPLLAFTLLVSVSLSLQQKSTPVKYVRKDKGYECNGNFYFRLPGRYTFKDAERECKENNATMLNTEDTRMFLCVFALIDYPNSEKIDPRYNKVWKQSDYGNYCYCSNYTPYCELISNVSCEEELLAVCKREVDQNWKGNDRQCPEGVYPWSK